MILNIVETSNMPPSLTVAQLRDILGMVVGGGLSIVFAGAKGATPTTSPTVAGQYAINQSTNELWFVNSSLAWQQIIKV